MFLQRNENVLMVNIGPTTLNSTEEKTIRISN